MLVRIHCLLSPTTKYSRQINVIQSRCCLHSLRSSEVEMKKDESKARQRMYPMPVQAKRERYCFRNQGLHDAT